MWLCIKYKEATGLSDFSGIYWLAWTFFSLLKKRENVPAQFIDKKKFAY